MADQKYTFEQARIRLEEIAAEVRKKDTSLEKSLDLLEEGVRLANICTELVDHTDLGASVTVDVPDAAPEASGEPIEPAAADAATGVVGTDAVAIEEETAPADAADTTDAPEDAQTTEDEDGESFDEIDDEAPELEEDVTD